MIALPASSSPCPPPPGPRARAHRLLSTLVVALAAAVLAAGCDFEEFTPASRIDKPRIIAVSASPPVIGLDGESELTALVVDADGRDSTVATEHAIDPADLDVRWRACNPWAPVFEPDRDCPTQEALALVSNDGEAWQGQARVRVSDVLAAFPPPDWVQDEIGQMDDGDGDGDGGEGCPHDYGFVELPIVVEVDIGDRRLVALQRLRVTWDPVVRRGPAIAALVLGDQVVDATEAGSFVAGRQIRLGVSMDRDSLDPVCLDDDPDQVADEPVTYFAYVTAGELLDEFEADVAYEVDGTESARTLRWAAPTGGGAVVWLVAEDRDGGVGWARFGLTAGAAAMAAP
ncbi:hypothetical protein [Haliangium sp.]|uniref:hypothetical protein n=1 Tax=Haliangium sp. TaxID=2663208 RepID=UPI003D0B2E47